MFTDAPENELTVLGGYVIVETERGHRQVRGAAFAPRTPVA
jgi:hypothetical protein